MGIIAWQLSLENCRLGTFDCNCRFGTFAWELSLGTFAWELSLGNSGWGNWAPVTGGTAGRQLAEQGSCDWGNRWTAPGGTLAGDLRPLPVKKLYKHPLEIPKGIPS